MSEKKKEQIKVLEKKRSAGSKPKVERQTRCGCGCTPPLPVKD